ncbi:MAG: 3-deoxy-8-phosphooctulonate synthase, partial [Planctomycetota bacterium]
MPTDESPSPSPASRRASVGPYACGAREPLLLIAGPCVLEEEAAAVEIGHAVKAAAEAAGVSAVFKASFDKANRTSI